MAPKAATAGVKQIFRGLVIATAGDFGDGCTERHVAGWVTLRGGEFSQELDGSVTHLVCTDAEYKARGPRVKATLRMRKKCHIVTKDWLEDSCRKQQKKPERAYLCSAADQAARVKEKQDKNTCKGYELAENYVNIAIYHIYCDSTFFRYDVSIFRDDEENGVEGERYVLSIFESNAKPQLYLFAAKHYKKKGDSHPSYYRPSATSQQFHVEFGHFKRFFLLKTWVHWNDRLAQSPYVREKFRYEPPTGGKPVGAIEGKCPQEPVPPSTPEAVPPVCDSSPIASVTDGKETETDDAKMKDGEIEGAQMSDGQKGDTRGNDDGLGALCQFMDTF